MTKRVKKKHRRAKAKQLANYIYDRTGLPGVVLVTSKCAYFFSDFHASRSEPQHDQLYCSDNPNFLMYYPELEMRGVVDSIVVFKE